VMPTLLRQHWLRLHERQDLSGLLLSIRRWAIAGILLLGYVYFRGAGEAYALVSIGLISFAAVAQFAPSIFGAIYWKEGTKNGAIAGLLTGFAVWGYTLLLPSFAKSGWLSSRFIEQGLFGTALLKPHELFGVSGLDEISHTLFWSMLANIGAYVGVSLAGRPSPVEADQATLFVDVFRRTAQDESSRMWRGSVHVGDLLPLIGRFVGPERAREAFLDFAQRRGVASIDGLQATGELVNYAETLLAGAIGSASARVMVASVTKEERLGIDDVMNILDEASHVREELGTQTALLDELFESAPEAIVMFDMESRVLRINREFLRMFGYTREDVIGRHIRELTVPEDLRNEWETLRAKATRGEQINVETIRQRKDGTRFNVSLLGSPIHHGGRQIGVYAIYRDIGERKRAEEEIRQQLEELQRWHSLTLDREERVQTLKREVNELLVRLRQPVRYPSQEVSSTLPPVTRVQR
jgi:PAS domain S-box-containing protein